MCCMLLVSDLTDIQRKLELTSVYGSSAAMATERVIILAYDITPAYENRV